MPGGHWKLGCAAVSPVPSSIQGLGGLVSHLNRWTDCLAPVEGKGLSHLRIAHIHGQWHCVENEVSFQGRERLHTAGAVAPLTEGGSQRLAWDPLVKSFTLPQHSHGGFIHAVSCPRPR